MTFVNPCLEKLVQKVHNIIQITIYSNHCSTMSDNAQQNCSIALALHICRHNANIALQEYNYYQKYSRRHIPSYVVNYTDSLSAV